MQEVVDEGLDDATHYRAIAASGNFLTQDPSDVAYTVGGQQGHAGADPKQLGDGQETGPKLQRIH